MNSKKIGATLCALLLFLMASAAWATDIRGRVFSESVRGYYPRPYAIVVIYYFDRNTGQPQPFSQAQTGPDGFYYFYNLQPGQFWLQFNGGQLVPINVPHVPAYDLPPYTLYE